jgi:amino acid adenylation domain-containing protein
MRGNGVEVSELSPLQAGILYHGVEDDGAGVYVVRLHFVLRGTLDTAAFSEAWRQVVDRHPVLRSSFSRAGEMRQHAHRTVELPFEYQDWRALPEEEKCHRFEARMRKEGRLGFDLVRPPLLRLFLACWDETSHHLLLSHHHILMDGWSRPVLFRDLQICYEALRQGRRASLAPPRPYREYVEWLAARDLSEGKRFWRTALQGFRAPTPLGVDQRLLPAEGEEPYGKLTRRLSGPATDRLLAFARQNRVTPNTVAQGAWALLLSRYSREEDVVFGAVTLARPPELEGFEETVGLFINTLPARVRVSPGDHVGAWLRRLQLDQVEAREHACSPLYRIRQWSEVPAGAPLFESLIAFENVPDVSEPAGDGLCMELAEARDWTNYALTLEVETGDRLGLILLFDRRRFDEAVAERALGHLEVLLLGLTADPEARLRELPVLTEDERRQIVVEWNETARQYPREPRLHHLIEAQAARTPERPAVKHAGEVITYRELNRRANALAGRLRERGVRPDTLVGVCMERSLELVVALLAVLKAGGAYVPLDPDNPRARLAFLVEDAQAPLVLTQRQLQPALPTTGAEVLIVDADAANEGREKDEGNLPGLAGSDDLAYVIYTSGSTGQPKGVMISHRSICNRLLWGQDEYGLTPEDRVLQKTPFSFDVSVPELFWPLMTGALLVVARHRGHRDSRYLVDVIREEAITTVHFVPSMLQALLDEPGIAECRSLRRVFCSGEALSRELQDRVLDRLGTELHNLYGPTEAAVEVTHWRCRRDGPAHTVPIGHPVANTQLHVLDPGGQPVPVGVAGELHIGGVQLARGYWRREALTAERFVPNPLCRDGSRLYRTGDLARYLPDGSIEFLGRLDDQFKIRGFRVELGEIEHHLGQHASVGEGVVDCRVAASGDRRLVAYVVPVEGGGPTGGASREHLGGELREFLSLVLPDYMVPSTYVLLEALPRTTSGKVDRRNLPEPSATRSGKPLLVPSSQMERTVAEVWREVLEIEEVRPDDNFFDLGGHSLLALKAATRLEARTGVRVHSRDMVFQTLRQVAAVCEGRASAAANTASDVDGARSPGDGR